MRLTDKLGEEIVILEQLRNISVIAEECYQILYLLFSVGCVIPHDRPRFPFNDMEISMTDICILDILIISILELFHAFFHAHKRGKAHFSALMSMEKLHVYHLGL